MPGEAKYLSVDPGISTGWVLWDATGVMISQGTARSPEEFDDWLHNDCPPVATVIYENYRLFRHKALQQSGSKLETSQVIGLLKSWARRNKCEVVEQPSSILAIAQLWSGMKMPKNHSVSHWVSAYNHGFYYLVKAKVRELELRAE